MRDEQFIRGNLPMTKEEVRAVSLSKLELTPGAVFWDIGAGTGSVAVEAAEFFQQIDRNGRESFVYAVERKEEGIELIGKNQKKLVPEFSRFFLIQGDAPEILENLPVPSHVFIGGTGGRLKKIVGFVFEKNPCARVVINAVTAESFLESMEIIRYSAVRFYDIVQVSVSRIEQAGKYHMHKGQNPVYVITLQG